MPDIRPVLSTKKVKTAHGGGRGTFQLPVMVIGDVDRGRLTSSLKSKATAHALIRYSIVRKRAQIYEKRGVTATRNPMYNYRNKTCSAEISVSHERASTVRPRIRLYCIQKRRQTHRLLARPLSVTTQRSANQYRPRTAVDQGYYIVHRENDSPGDLSYEVRNLDRSHLSVHPRNFRAIYGYGACSRDLRRCDGEQCVSRERSNSRCFGYRAVFVVVVV